MMCLIAFVLKTDALLNYCLWVSIRGFMVFLNFFVGRKFWNFFLRFWGCFEGIGRCLEEEGKQGYLFVGVFVSEASNFFAEVVD